MSKTLKNKIGILTNSRKSVTATLLSMKYFPYWTLSIFFTFLTFWRLAVWKNPRGDFHLAAIIQTLVFLMGLIITNISLIYLAKSTEFTNELLNIERKRDLQANLISAWLDVDARPSGENNLLFGIASFMNASFLPVYDLSYKVRYIKGDYLVDLDPLINSKGFVTSVVPPTLSPRTMWVVDGIRDISGKQIRSQDFFSQEKLQTSFYQLDFLGLTEKELATLTIEITFRCVDESKWKRHTSGRLEEIHG